MTDQSITQSVEIWKPVVGYETDYEISSEGRLRRKTISRARRSYPAGMILKLCQMKNGYVTFTFSLHSKRTRLYIHRIVMATFVGECPEKQEVNHKNGNRADNRLCNLEYVTRSRNNLHSYRELGRIAVPPIGPKNFNWKLTDDQIREIRRKFENRVSYAELGRQYDVHWTSIRGIIKGESHRYVK